MSNKVYQVEDRKVTKEFLDGLEQAGFQLVMTLKHQQTTTPTLTTFYIMRAFITASEDEMKRIELAHRMAEAKLGYNFEQLMGNVPASEETERMEKMKSWENAVSEAYNELKTKQEESK